MDPKIIGLFNEFAQGGVDRREFLNRLTQLAGSSGAALALITLFDDHAKAQVIPENDNRLAVSRVEYDASGTKISGYLARLEGGKKRPAVIVIHEVTGLNPHIQDVTRRMAVEGFLALAPDMLSPLGGTPSDGNEAIKMVRTLKIDETVSRLASAVTFRGRRPESTGKVGVVGFCWGGQMVNYLAAAGTSLNAGVSYYGYQLPAADVPKITAPLLLHYGSLDDLVNPGIPAYRAALEANNKAYEMYMYEDAMHGFNNDTNAVRYNKEAADLAWGRTIEFLKKHLSG